MAQAKAHEYTATKVRADFTYARNLMRQIDEMMRSGIADFSEAGDAGQLALDLNASVSCFEAFLTERRAS